MQNINYMLGKLKLFFLMPFLILISPLQVFATTTYSSSHYSANQVFFGSGGGQETDPTNGDVAQVSVGETGVGNFKSSNYGAWAGFNTTADPFLEAVVTAENLNLGVLNTAVTATGTGTFYVRAWNAHGYVVQTDSPPPSTSGHSFATNATPTSSTAGTEQFGMNLVADTTPSSLLTDSPATSNPVQTTVYPYTAPSSCPPTSGDAIAYGCAYGNYLTTNKYAYNNGDTIAQSTKSTSDTIYTISYIFNISTSTPAGNYIFNQNLVVTATY
jgi:hypothetical protein